MRRDDFLIHGVISPGKSISKFLCTFPPFRKVCIIFHRAMEEWFRSASGEVLTKLCKQCPWDTLMCPPRYSLPGINIPHFRGLVSDLHMEWPRISLPKGRKGARGCHRLTEMVVNIYGPKKERINNAVSQVEVPLAESQTSFSGHRRCEAWEPV